MTIQQWAMMMMLRTELVYDVPAESNAETCAQCPLLDRGCEVCAQCQRAAQHFTPLAQPRWSADLTFQCALFDTVRRMELVRRAGAHVRRPGFQGSLTLINKTTADSIQEASMTLGDKAGFRDALRGNAPESLKRALSDVLLFSAEVVGSDGARQRLRHEQMGDMLRFGPIGGFLTPNVADTRHPIVVMLHADSLNGTQGGLADDGTMERYEVDLLQECPDMPKAEEMLKIIARNPVAQARFFIISMRLFCEHILGLGPFDNLLRHHGPINGVEYPDGYATSLMGGSFNFIASLHGPIEEQARLSCHSHMVFQYVHTQSQAWLRDILRMQTEQARNKLRQWQEAVISAVEATQITAAGVVPLVFVDHPCAAPELRSTPYLERWRDEDRFDGELEQDCRDPDKRRVDVPASAPFCRSPYRAQDCGEQRRSRQDVHGACAGGHPGSARP